MVMLKSIIWQTHAKYFLCMNYDLNINLIVLVFYVKEIRSSVQVVRLAQCILLPKDEGKRSFFFFFSKCTCFLIVN